VRRKVIAELEIVAAFIGHHLSVRMNICLHNRKNVGNRDVGDMEAASLASLTIDETENHILVSKAARTLGNTFKASDCGLIDLLRPRQHRSSAQGQAQAVRHKPCALERDPQRAVKLICADAFLR
jgi:hypothetical protein